MHAFSPAKLNLFFRVLAKREDGYHEIASLMGAIDFGDHLTITKSVRDRFTTCEPSLLSDPTNTVLKALALFRLATKIDHPVDIHLEKEVPFGSGMGGGSSNGATTLFLLNELFDRPLEKNRLIDLAKEIGSDAPFFLSKGLAYCTGRGEQCVPFEAPLPSDLWIAVPLSLSSSTPLVYKQCRPGEVSKEDPALLLASFLTPHPQYVNDLEPAAMRLNRLLEVKKRELISFGMPPLAMTGSGSTFFGQGELPSVLPPGFLIRPIQFVIEEKN